MWKGRGGRERSRISSRTVASCYILSEDCLCDWEMEQLELSACVYNQSSGRVSRTKTMESHFTYLDGWGV